MIGKIFVSTIRLYQRYISPMTAPSCRFYPTCSHYSAEAIEKYGAVKGGFKSVTRVLKCHPFHPGGYDPVD